MLGGDKDGVGTNSVHVNAGPRLDIIEVDITVLGDQVHHAVLLGHLKQETGVVLSCRICRTDL